MKKSILSLLVFGLALTISVAQTTDETNIKKVIDAQDVAFHTVDYKAYMSHWAKVPYASFLYSDGNYVGDALWKKIEEFWVGRKPSKVSTTRTNWNFHIKDDTAFVTFSEKNEYKEAKSITESFQARYLEKVEDVWKLVSITVVNKPSR